MKPLRARNFCSSARSRVVVVDDEDVRLLPVGHGRPALQPAEHAVAHLGVDHLLEHLAEAVHRLGPGGGEGRAHPPPLRRRELLLERAARLGQVQVAVAAVLDADPALDQAVVDQLAQHAVQALLGDAEEVEELVDGEPGAAVDEVDRPVVGAAVVAQRRGCGRGRR